MTVEHTSRRAPRGTELSCANWAIEAPYRMLLNNLDPEVAEDPEQLIVYGGSGKAARNHAALEGILATLRRLKPDETMLVQSGKCVAVFRTHEDAPRVLIANSNLVGDWANWDEFRRLEALGLTMYGQMTAGSWIYIGSQGIVQGTYETFAAAGQKHYGAPELKGKLVVTAGLGGMGGAQPLAAVIAGAVCLAADVDPARIDKRLETRYLDKASEDLDEAIAWALEAKQNKEAISIGWIGNAVDLLEALLERGITPDMLTDQTSAHDLLNGYVPHGIPYADALALRESDPVEYERRAGQTAVAHVDAMNALMDKGAVTFDYGNNLRGHAQEHGHQDAFRFPGFVPAYVRPLFCEGKGPFRWLALTGEESDIARTDQLVLETFPDDEPLCRWIQMAGEKVAFQGLPARICWLGAGERAKLGLAINELVAKGEIGPIAIGRDHLDTGSVASPNRETEAMKDGSDAVSDWPLLNALLNCASGATWVSLHHGGGVGMGFSQHSGMVICCDGTEDADRRIERVLWNDPATGVMRHADAGYEIAQDCAKENGLLLPGILGN